MNTKTNERRFDIMFDGTTLNGADVSEVKSNLQQLFKLGDADIERMFCGQPISIKKNLDRKTATQFQQALSRAGAKIQLVLHQPNTEADNSLPTASEQVATDSTTMAATATQKGGLDVLPAGSDLLAASERSSTAPLDIATDHLQVENPAVGSSGRAVFDLGGTSGASADATTEGVGRYPAADHIELDTALSVAELGAILEQDSIPAPAASVSVDHLQLVEPADITPSESGASPPPAAAAVESDLSIAEAGSDLLQAHEKRQQVEADIDLSKISLRED